MRLRQTWVFFALTAAGVCFVAGCSTGPEMAPVKGKVTLDGKPLAKGTIRFEAPGHRAATGKIEDGEIVEMTTYKPNDGAPVGSHKVAIWATADAAPAVVTNPGQGKVGENYMSGKSLIPAKYNDPATSGLTADIPSGGGTVSFELSSDADKKK
jgi:hypothetical protein